MNNIEQNGWKISNVFVELRFAPAPEFFNRKQELFQKLFSDFPNYNMQNFDSIAMHTKEHPGLSLNIMPNRFIFTTEKPSEIEDFLEKAKKVWKIIYEDLKINIVERFGMRIYLTKELKQNDVNEKITKFINKNIIDSKFNLNSADVVLNLKEGNRNLRISINAGTSQTIVISPIPVQTQVAQGILVDMDFFVEGTKAEDVKVFLAEGINKILDCQHMVD